MYCRVSGTSRSCQFLGFPGAPTQSSIFSGGGSLGVSEAVIRQAFESAYLASFSRLLPGLPMRIVSLRVAAIGREIGIDADLPALPPVEVGQAATPAAAAAAVTDAAAE